MIKCWLWFQKVAHAAAARRHHWPVHSGHHLGLVRPAGIRRVAKITCVVIGSGGAAIGAGAVGGHLASGGGFGELGPGPTAFASSPPPSGFTAFSAPPVSEIEGTREVVPVPEPSSLLLFAAGIAGLIFLRKRRR